MSGAGVVEALAKRTDSKIVLMVIDGFGDVTDPETGNTYFDEAVTPNMDAHTTRSICGLHTPIAPGITPGSGPAHMALFGYDPLEPEHNVGRGVLEALGIQYELKHGELATRGNFATVNTHGDLTDRRAGRPSTEKNAQLCQLIRERLTPQGGLGPSLDGVEIDIQPVREHRFLAVFKGREFSSQIIETDPLVLDVPPLSTKPLVDAPTDIAVETAKIVNGFITKVFEILKEEQPANAILLRGFSTLPEIPSMTQRFKLTPAAVATYPMYRGVAGVVGMEVLDVENNGPGPVPMVADQFDTMKKRYDDFDFFFIHYKPTDSSGEDGDGERKVKALEDLDKELGALFALSPDVVVLTGDHSTPWSMKLHSWHEVPVVVSGPNCSPDQTRTLADVQKVGGKLGHIRSVDIMPIALANAGKLTKFGA